MAPQAVVDAQWGRVVMNQHCQQRVREMGPEKLGALEVSAEEWRYLMPFQKYTTVQYPEYDVCETVLDERFDLIIAEQVFEHLLWPYRAGKNIHRMLRPGGYFLISTPFLIKIHSHPVDCSRWTEIGLKHLLAECGFSIDHIETFSWGNRACIKANFRKWVRHRKWRSLRNERDFPYVIWAFAKKV